MVRRVQELIVIMFRHENKGAIVSGGFYYRRRCLCLVRFSMFKEMTRTLPVAFVCLSLGRSLVQNKGPDGVNNAVVILDNTIEVRIRQ
jgi:hypothetical protein